MKSTPLFLLISLTACSVKKERTQCFENRYPYQDASDKSDILNLSYSLEGKEVSGEYNWLPLEKDKREGHFIGTLENGIITAIYHFRQEGISDSTQISITLKENKALVREPGSNFGFEAEISQIDCD